MNYANYFNPKNNSDRIFTREDVRDMQLDEFREHWPALRYQMVNIGMPDNSILANSSDVVYVRAYTRDDGTQVKAHYRSKRKSSNIDTNYRDRIKQSNPIKDFNYVLNSFLNKNRFNTRLAFDLFNYGIKGVEISDQANIIGNTVEYKWGSKLSEDVSNDEDFKKGLKKVYNRKADSVSFKNNSDLYLSIGKAKVKDLRIKDGYYIGYLEDVYDFDKDWKYKSGLISAYNNYAYGMQWLEPSRVYNVKVPFRVKID